MECGKAPCGVRKVKKKQVKDELDRIKQAEKKKRRLEKALATSAAIISELEKKKQKKKEEQQRLDEDCAAIAEAVALQVLIGEESDDPRGIIPYPHQLSMSPTGGTGWGYDGCGGSRCEWDGCGYGYGSGDGYGRAPYVGWDATEVSAAGLIAAQAISSLQITDDGVNAFVFNRMLRG